MYAFYLKQKDMQKLFDVRCTEHVQNSCVQKGYIRVCIRYDMQVASLANKSRYADIETQNLWKYVKSAIS